MLRAIAKLIYFKLLGWSIEGRIDRSIKKYIVIVAPHTSNWDFPLGVLVRKIVNITDAKYLGKSSLFKWRMASYFVH